MDQQTLEQALDGLPLGPVRYFDRVGSTNDLALAWAQEGAPHLSLVVADEQFAGRGRGGRRWYTPPAAALAISVVLHPQPGLDLSRLPRLAGLGGLAVCEALQACHGLQASLKWPNDVLIGGRKTAGVLAESHWLGDALAGLVLGIGLNLTARAVPPAELLDFPATAVEVALGQPADRLALLRQILVSVVRRWPELDTDAFLLDWGTRLAYQGEQVQVLLPGEERLEGRILGLTSNGDLRLRDQTGVEVVAQAGEVRLRPLT
jgi:BirA family biotin operon repressor/biotin-[acetyl-CoA-carboxylase] ligase